MRWLVMVLFAGAAAVLQTCWPAAAMTGQAKCPFLLSVVLYYALAHDAGTMLIAGLVAGFFQDALSDIPLGYSSACFCLAGLVVGRFKTLVSTESPWPLAFFGAVSSAVVMLGMYVLLRTEGLIACPAGWLARKILWTSVFGALCTPVMFGADRALDRLVGNVAARGGVTGID